MHNTYKCRLDEKSACFEDIGMKAKNVISRRDFDGLINRRQLNKMSIPTRMATAMFQHFSINDKLRKLSCDPANTPIVICNRYANWDYVAESMSPSITETMDSVNSYVATAWFPATVQGHLTIENGNKGEAITISTKDKDLIRATINALMPTNDQATNAVILGTFEYVPSQIAGQNVIGKRPAFCGALSLIRSSDSSEAINLAINLHQEIYSNDSE